MRTLAVGMLLTSIPALSPLVGSGQNHQHFSPPGTGRREGVSER